MKRQPANSPPTTDLIISILLPGVVHSDVCAAIGAMHIAITPHFIVVSYFVIFAATLWASFVVVDYVPRLESF